jgi:glycosyltransferase involved in cell wall biosynthesis
MKTAVRVLHVITAFDRGGAENHVADLIRHQRNRGMEVSLAFLRGRGSLGPEMERVGAEIRPLGLRFYGDLGPLLRLRRLVKRGAFDLIHAHLPPAELYVRVALLGIPATTLPLVISKHNDCPFHGGPAERSLARWVGKRASSMIAISEAVRRYMSERQIGAAPCRLVTIPYGIDVHPFEQVQPERIVSLRGEWGLEPETLAIGFAGRLVEQKSIETLIRAYAIFRQQAQTNSKLILVGEGPLLGMLRRTADECGMTKHVVWAGFREDIPTVMKAFDVFALPSVFEGFGLVLVEAMAAKRPVVATRVSAIPEVVADGATGFLTPARDPRAMADALLKLQDSTKRAQLGLAGHRRVLEHFTLEQMWQSTDVVYADCVRVPAARDRARAAAAASLT